MSAAQALKAARAAGIDLDIDGDDLVLEAREQPPMALLDLLARHKSGLLALLRPPGDGWSVKDWQSYFDERAGIAEYDGGLPRCDAEMCAFEDCVDHWLTMHPPLANEVASCLCCGISVSKEHGRVGVTCSGGAAGWLHSECAPKWRNLRRWDARSALVWLLERTGTPATR